MKHLRKFFACLLTFVILGTTPLPASAQEVDDILSHMTMEEKVGQLFMVWFKGDKDSPFLHEAITKRHVGGLILYDIAGNIQNPAQVARLTNTAQRLAHSSGSGVGLFISIDQEGGPVVRLKNGFTVMPSNLAVGATGSPQNAALAARVMAKELRAVGINTNLAPNVDVNSNPDNPIIGTRSYGDSADMVATYAASAIRAYEEQCVMPVIKHFPGHGDTGFDSHLRLPLVPHSRERLNKVELAPFTALKDITPAIMTAHVAVPAIEPSPDTPATLSPRVLTNLLRREMNFDGLIFTDSLGMGAISNTFGAAHAALKAFEAGADILLFGADKGHTPDETLLAIDALTEAVRSGKIAISRLDASVRRILSAKKHYGALSPLPVNAEEAPSKTATPKHLAIAESIAAKATTVLRDRMHTLPLAANHPPLVVLPEDVADAGQLMALFPQGTRFEIIASDPSPALAEAIIAKAGDSPIVMLLGRTARFASQPALLAELAKRSSHRPLIAVALDMPEHTLAVEGAPCVIATRSAVPASLRALTSLLFDNSERP